MSPSLFSANISLQFDANVAIGTNSPFPSNRDGTVSRFRVCGFYGHEFEAIIQLYKGQKTVHCHATYKVRVLVRINARIMVLLVALTLHRLRLHGLIV